MCTVFLSECSSLICLRNTVIPFSTLAEAARLAIGKSLQKRLPLKFVNFVWAPADAEFQQRDSSLFYRRRLFRHHGTLLHTLWSRWSCAVMIVGKQTAPGLQKGPAFKWENAPFYQLDFVQMLDPPKSCDAWFVALARNRFFFFSWSEPLAFAYTVYWREIPHFTSSVFASYVLGLLVVDARHAFSSSQWKS